MLVITGMLEGDVVTDGLYGAQVNLEIGLCRAGLCWTPEFSRRYLKSLALPLDNVDIELQLRNHLLPHVGVPHHVGDVVAVLLDLLQQPSVGVPQPGCLAVEAVDDLVRGLSLARVSQDLQGAGETEDLLLLALQQTVDAVDVLQQEDHRLTVLPTLRG